MKIQHLLVEGYCDGTVGEEIYPCENSFRLGIHCFKCSQFSFCECPNEIAVSGEKGSIECDEDCIGFGGDMEPDTLQNRDKCISIWRNICRRKRHGVKFCVSEIRQSQGWRSENGANWRLEPFLTRDPGRRGGMRTAGGVNAALAVGIR